MIYNLLFLLYLIEIIGFFVIAYIVLANKRHSFHTHFAAFASLVGVWQLNQFLAILFRSDVLLSSIFVRLSVMASPFMALEFFMFAALYTGKTVPKRVLIYLSATAVSIISLFSPEIQKLGVTSKGLGIPGLDVWYGIVISYAAICIMAGIILILKNYNKQTDNNRRIQDKILLGGIIFAFILVISSSFRTERTYDIIFAQQIIPLTSIVVMVLFVYAMLFRGLFDIRPLVARLIAYTASIMFVVLIFMIITTLMVRTVFKLDIDTTQTYLLLIWSVMLALSFNVIKRFFDKVTSFIFFQNPYSPQAVLSELNALLASTIDLRSLLNGGGQILQNNLKPQYVVFVINKTNEASVIYSSDERDYSRLINDYTALDKYLEKSNKKILYESEATEEVISRLFVRCTIAVALRITANGENLGLLIIGNPKSGGKYYHNDIQLLETAVDSMAIAVQNALRYEEISQFNLTLQKKVDNATLQLQRSNEKLKALDEAKDEFISMASHQLRTPLTSVKGYVSMVLEGDAGEINEQQRTFLDQAMVSSQRMVYLIADLLNVSRLKTGKFVIDARPTYLPDVVESEINQLYETAKGRELTLKFTKPKSFPTVALDETKIRQVIMNFVDNAIYYTPKGGKIDVLLKANPKSVEFVVKDSGIGVPRQDQHKLFSKFYRAGNARKARPDGTGLGLYMAKKVVVAQGGAIIFETKENQGSVFGFTFPIPASPTEKH